MKWEKTGKRLLSALLSAVLTVTMIPTVDGIGEVYATQPDKTVACLGTDAVKAPEKGETDKEWTGSYVWYGAYDGNPVRYRVLAPKTTEYGGTTLFLDCDTILYTTEFDEDRKANEGAQKANEWAYSDVKNGLNGSAFLEKENGFSTPEKAAIAESSIGTRENTVGNLVNYHFPYYTALDRDKVFLLDCDDLVNTEYGYTQDSGFSTEDGQWKTHEVKNRIKKADGSASKWWLRSAVADRADLAGNVHQKGVCSTQYDNLASGVSPAFNINLQSVLFSSVTSGTAGENGAEYKLTLLDDDMKVAVKGEQVTAVSGNEVSLESYKLTISGNELRVPYAVKGEHSGNASQVSVLVLDKEYTVLNSNDAEILYYGRLATNDVFETEGEGILILPKGLNPKDWGTKYQVYLLAEDINGTKQTDYASAPIRLDFVYQVSFDANGGTGSKESFLYDKDADYTLPECTFTAPEGKEFAKWNLGEPGASVKITENTVIKAIWKDLPIPKCTIFFDANGGSGSMESVEVTKDTDYTLPECRFAEPQDKEFVKWNLGEAGATVKITEDTVIKAVWKDIPKYTVSFDANGGSGSMESVEVTKDTDYTLPECRFAEPQDKEFVKWNLGEPGASVKITEDTVVKAIWKDIPISKCTISFDANGGSGSMESVEVTKDTDYTLPTCIFTAPEGKEFAKWNLGESGASVKITEDTVVKAIWKDIPISKCTISFDANGGSGSMESVEVTKDTDYTLPECRFAEPQDKEFVKWNLGEAGASIKITEDTVLKAVWKEKFVKNEIVDDKVTGGKYMVASLKKKNGKVTGGTVTYVKPKDINCKTIKATGKVRLKGVVFDVTAIAPDCAKGCKNLRKVVLEKTVTTVGKGAFEGCGKLKIIIIKGTKLKKIGANAFQGIHSKAKFKVPKKKLARYQKMIKKAGAPKKANITK